MGYSGFQEKELIDSNKLFKKIIKAIEKENIYFIQDVCLEVAVARRTFYNHFPLGSDKYDKIDMALNKNKSRTKRMLHNIFMSTLASPSERIFMYKLLACDEAKRQLNPAFGINQTTPTEHRITLVDEASPKESTERSA
jgi:hypothetical protein